MADPKRRGMGIDGSGSVHEKEAKSGACDAEKTVCGGWGTCPVPSPANGWFTGSHLLLDPAVPAPTARLFTSLPISGHGPVCPLVTGAGSEGGRHSPERFRFLSLFSLWSWVKSCPHRKKWENWPKFFLLGLLHPPPSPPQRILTTCTSDVRAIPPPIVDGMPCLRSMIRAASWGVRHHDPLQPGPTSEFSLTLSSTHPDTLSGDRAVAIVSGPGRGRPIAGCWTCNRPLHPVPEELPRRNGRHAQRGTSYHRML